MIRSYPCVIVGFQGEGRVEYVAEHVREGDAIELRRDRSNEYDENAVACYHRDRLIGFIPSSKTWVCKSIDEGETHAVTVAGLGINDDGDRKYVDIDIKVVSDIDGSERATAIPPVIDKLGTELRIIVMIAAADGRFQKVERDLIEKFASIRAAEVGLTVDADEIAHAVRWARRHVPAGTLGIRGLIADVSDQPDSLQAIWEMTKIIAEADGEINDYERRAVDLVRTALKAVGYEGGLPSGSSDSTGPLPVAASHNQQSDENTSMGCPKPS